MNNFVSIFDDIYKKIMDNFYKNENKKMSNDITHSEDYYLNIIYSLKKITLTKFAEIAKVTKPAATQIINKFIRKGYVVKSVSENDKRVCYVEVTEQVKKHLKESYKKLNNIYNECLSFLTEEEMTQFNHILLKINNNL